MGTLRDESKNNFTTNDFHASVHEIQVGAMQRAADALESMAKPFRDIWAENKAIRERLDAERECTKRMGRRISALQGVITRMKRKRK